MSFVALSVICLVALAGPLLAYPKGWHLPVVLGELVAGIALGTTGIGYLKADNSTFAFLANVGFALVMFVAGTHVPVRDRRLRPALRAGILRVLVVGVMAVALGVGIAVLFGTGHGPLYAVLLASSSAALILPIVDSLGLGGDRVIQLLPQIAIADAACIIALPLAIDPQHAGRAAVGAAAVLAAGLAVFFVLNELEKRGIRHRVHKVSEDRSFAVELRVNLTILFALAALAARTHVSIMLAGFVFGLAVSAIGEPRRLAKQLFALTEGFLGPVFFVWLGASLNLRDLGSHPKFLLLGVVLGLAALLTHATARMLGQPLSLTMLASAQLGVPVAAATIGRQLGVLRAGEPAALILGALVTVAVAVLGGSLAVRAGFVEPAASPKATKPAKPAKSDEAAAPDTAATPHNAVDQEKAADPEKAADG